MRWCRRSVFRLFSGCTSFWIDVSYDPIYGLSHVTFLVENSVIVLESDEDLRLGWIMHKYTVVTTRYSAPHAVCYSRMWPRGLAPFIHAEGDGTFPSRD